MKIISIVGARPQFVKLAPVSQAMSRYQQAHGLNDEHVCVHTGQHYHKLLSDVFFEDLGIHDQVRELGVGSGSHGQQTGEMLKRIEAALRELKPSAVVVYGDTNSTLAGALAAVKMEIPTLHVESGLRSFNRSMPEEINRIVTDHISDRLCAPTEHAMRNLEFEGLAARATLTGDVMFDAVQVYRSIALTRRAGSQLHEIPEHFGLVTVHRAENTLPANLSVLLESLRLVSEEVLPLVFPVHPRTTAAIEQNLRGWKSGDRLFLIEPVGYLDMLDLVSRASLVLTDSGGLQKEAAFIGTPCVTLRLETEWLETVELGANRLAGITAAKVLPMAKEALNSDRQQWQAKVASYYGNGTAADRTVEEIFSLANG